MLFLEGWKQTKKQKQKGEGKKTYKKIQRKWIFWNSAWFWTSPIMLMEKKKIIEKELDIEETHLKKDAFSDKKVWIKKYQKKKRKKATKI